MFRNAWLMRSSKVIGISLAVLGVQMAAAFLSLHFKGQVFESVGVKDQAISGVLTSAALLISFHVLSVFAKSLLELLTTTYGSGGALDEWNERFPGHIDKAGAGEHASFYSCFMQLAPQERRLERSSHLALAHALVTYLIYLGMIFIDRFWPGLVYLAIVSWVSFFSGRLMQKKLSGVARALENQEIELMKWLEAFFKGALERQTGWLSYSESRKWYSGLGSSYVDGIIRYESLKFLKNVSGNLFIDLPYFCFTIALIVFAISNHLSLAKVVVWLGMAEFIVAANGSLSGYFRNRIQLRNLKQMLKENLKWMKPVPSLPALHPRQNNEREWRFVLKDSSLVRLSTRREVHLIQGANGSGKSSLLHAILGYSSECYGWDRRDVDEIRGIFQGRSRVLDPNVALYPNLKSLEQQLLGPDAMESKDALADLQRRLRDRLTRHLEAPLVEEWLVRFEGLKVKWTDVYHPSSGEKAMIAFFRFAISLDDEVRLIVADEGDAFLDRATRRLWLKTLGCLAKDFTVYLVSHHLVKSLDVRTLVTSGHFIGYSRSADEGKMIDFQLTAITGGTGEVEALGNIGRALGDEVKMCITALIHTDPKYFSLRRLDFQIYCENKRLRVEEVTSGSLSIALALDDILSLLEGKRIETGIAATGRVLADGSVVPVAFLSQKVDAAKKCNYIQGLLTPSRLKNLRELRVAKSSCIGQVGF